VLPARKRIVLTSKIEFVSVTPWSIHSDLDFAVFKKSLQQYSRHKFSRGAKVLFGG
jgi:hypothetical protein